MLVEAARAGRFTVWNELFRPSLFVVWRTILAMTPEPAVGLHAVNVVLHGVNAWLVARVARGIGLPRAVALCAGGLFLSYPAAVGGRRMAVRASGRADDHVRPGRSRGRNYQPRGVARISVAGVALLAALLTKETAIAAPVLLAMLGLVREIRKRAWLTAAACAVVVAVFLGVRFSMLPLPANYSPAATRYAVKELLVRPYATLIVPFRADETVGHPVLGVLSVAFVVLMLAASANRSGWRERNSARAVAAACMVLGAVAPVLAYFYVDPDLFGSRYLYLALVGWVLMLATSANALSPRAGVAIAPLVCLIALWIPSTRSHLSLWQNAATTRERILAAAAAASDGTCAGWIVAGVPATLDGVPLFVNGFPEAARPSLGEPIHMAPATRAAGQCQLTWTGQTFKRATDRGQGPTGVRPTSDPNSLKAALPWGEVSPPARRSHPDAQPLDQRRIAALDRLERRDAALPVGGERRGNQRHPGPEVARVEQRPAQLLRAADDDAVRVAEKQIGAHRAQLLEREQTAARRASRAPACGRRPGSRAR